MIAELMRFINVFIRVSIILTVLCLFILAVTAEVTYEVEMTPAEPVLEVWVWDEVNQAKGRKLGY